MLKTLLLSSLLVVSMSSAATSQDQITSRLTLSVTGVPSGIGHLPSPHPFDIMGSKSADAARRFAARAAVDDDSPRFCTVRRWRCVLASAFLGAGAGMLIGNALGAEAKYEPDYNSIIPINKCVAHCDDRHRNASRFGLAGAVIGASTSLYLTR